MATATKTKAEVAKFKVKSFNNLVLFFKRFASMEKNLLLEITPDSIKSKSHTPDRSVVKYSKMDIADVLEVKSGMDVDLIKVAIYDINKIMNLSKHFGESDEIFMDLKYENIGGENIGTEFLFHTTSLKIKMTAADPSIGAPTYITSEMLKRMIARVKEAAVIEFPFPREAFGKISSLCQLDADKDYLHIKIVDGAAVVKGKSFEYNIGDVPKGSDVDFAFYNEHFAFIEPEISSVFVSDKQMFIKSSESDTFVIVGRAE